MINITEQAKQELFNLLAKKVDWPGARLRLLDRGKGKLGLGIDIETPGDYVIEYDGNKILLIEPELANTTRKITIDVDNTPQGAELVLSEKP